MEVLFPIAIILVYALIGIATIICLIVFIAKRIEDKKKETFEDRDN